MKNRPKIKRERLWATFNNLGEVIASGNQCRELATPVAVYCDRQEAEADCCEDAGDFVAEVVLVRARRSKRNGGAS